MSDVARKRDEMLEVIYWLRGEGLREDVRPLDLRTFLGLEPAEALDLMESLAGAGLLERVLGSEPTFRLTEDGALEAGRRFVESFADLLGQGHGTACAPGCACESGEHPAEDCPTHGRHAHRAVS